MNINATYLLIMGSLVACSSYSQNILGDNHKAGNARTAIHSTDCTHIIPNGTYSTTIDSSSYPPGSVVCAEDDGQVVFTGAFDPDGYNMRGFVVFSNLQKTVINGTFERMSFIGGAACGNNTNTGVGSNTIVRDSAFYGLGGRQLLGAYRRSGILISNAIFRVDGGWGEVQKDCNDKSDPNGAFNFYDTNNAVCDGCINIDQRPTAASNSETVGGLGINAHTSNTSTPANLCYSVEIRNSVDFNGTRFWADGSGTCDPVFSNNKGKVSINLMGNATVSDSSGSACFLWRGRATLNNNNFDSGHCGTGGVGVALNLDKEFLDDPRWRNEMCGGFSSRTDGWCGTQMLLSEYISR